MCASLLACCACVRARVRVYVCSHAFLCMGTHRHEHVCACERTRLHVCHFAYLFFYSLADCLSFSLSPHPPHCPESLTECKISPNYLTSFCTSSRCVCLFVCLFFSVPVHVSVSFCTSMSVLCLFIFFYSVSANVRRRMNDTSSHRCAPPVPISTNGKMGLVGCLTSQQHASVSQGRICEDNCTCCHIEIEVADQTFHLTLSQYTDTGPASPSADPITPGPWQGCQFLSHRYDSTRKNPVGSGNRTLDLPLSRRAP